MAEFNKSQIMHSSRLFHKYTRAAASEGICDELTLLRYEGGHISVSPKNFYEIMTRMGECGETVILPYTQDDIYIINLQNKISRSQQKHDYVECENYLNELINYDKFDTTIIENKQYIERLHLLIAYKKGLISNEERVIKLIQILQYTFKGYNGDTFPKHRVFSSTELSILNNIATTYQKLDKTDLALTLFENLFNYYKNMINLETSKPLYNILINYANLLGDKDQYDKCIEVCLLGIEWLNHRNTQNLLYYFYFYIGYCLLIKFKLTTDKKFFNKGKTYIDLSYNLCCFFPEANANKLAIKQLIDDNYNL